MICFHCEMAHHRCLLVGLLRLFGNLSDKTEKGQILRVEMKMEFAVLKRVIFHYVVEINGD